MVVFISGATHVGKTNLAQKMMEKYHFPYVCQDHIKMGLIRSNCIHLTPEEDEELEQYLWPITREMAKTAIENNQNLIIEGCYFPLHWKADFEDEYSRNIRFICLCMSDQYIEYNFHNIKNYASCIESRLEDESCTMERIKSENQRYKMGCVQNGLDYILIEDDYELAINKAMQL